MEFLEENNLSDSTQDRVRNFFRQMCVQTHNRVFKSPCVLQWCHCSLLLVTIGEVVDSERRILVSRYVGERYYDEKEALGPLPDALKVRTIAVGYP